MWAYTSRPQTIWQCMIPALKLADSPYGKNAIQSIPECVTLVSDKHTGKLVVSTCSDGPPSFSWNVCSDCAGWRGYLLQVRFAGMGCGLEDRGNGKHQTSHSVAQQVLASTRTVNPGQFREPRKRKTVSCSLNCQRYCQTTQSSRLCSWVSTLRILISVKTSTVKFGSPVLCVCAPLHDCTLSNAARI